MSRSSGAPGSSGREGTIASQPLDTGVGRHWATQLLYAVQFLKSHGTPIRLEDLALRSNVEALLTNPELLESFNKNEKVLVDQRTGLYSYKPDYSLRSEGELLTLLRNYSPRGGLSVRKLKESWPAVNTAIEQLENAGKVMVTRTGGTAEREGQMKAVFLDDIGRGEKVDKEFRQLWSSLKTPIAGELADQLRNADLKAASSVPIALTSSRKKKPRKGPGSHNRKLKIMNTHLRHQVDLTKDYTPTKR